MRITSEEVARRLGIDAQRVDELVRAGAIEPPEPGSFEPDDLHRVRLLVAFQSAGVPIDALVAAYRTGKVNFAFYDQLHPPPGPASSRAYAAFRDSLGQRGGLLSRVFAALGIAEPDALTYLSEADEELLADLVDIVVTTGQPEIALRALRMFGGGAERTADAALGAYQEAFVAQGEANLAFGEQEFLDRMLRPWARLARRSGDLAGWLTTRHMTRAIDEYSVRQTEGVLEDAGLLPERDPEPPGVAFVDLTGFTHLTETIGDEAAAGLALRLGEVTIDAVRPFDGRLVKLLGDGALVRFESAVGAVDGTLALLEALPLAGLPTGHAGVAAGPRFNRDGDVFGRTVNLAARLSDAAADGTVLVPASLVPELPGDRLAFGAGEAVGLQGIGRLDVVTVRRA
jgi:class 3 adenylate cyclase